ncbi:MAG: Para-nitrobenzyl esterase [Bacteroidia bacterium]|nr:Para-nitrobenzyl esterase [Bacteroidia bacterium]
MFSRFTLLTTVFISVAFYFSKAVNPDTTGLIVATHQGLLRGTTDNDVRVWRGVRYAQPPIGELRFKAPQPLSFQQGITDATAFGTVSPQTVLTMGSSEKQSEDCLFLNIWSSKKKTEKKPVMFWIHGGGFSIGSGSDEMYNGSRLSKNGDVVVVTFNYRLGPFGFLYLDHLKNDSLPFENNLGLRDQVAALKWVNENIASFGGDPDNITIFGESAGANSVLALLASPDAKGLFQKAIVQSAASVGQTSIENAKKMTAEYLQLLNITTDNISRLFTISADSLLAASDRLFEKVIAEVGDLITFAPVSGTDFLPFDPEVAIAKGFASGIPVMIGTNKDEANLFSKSKPALIKPEVETVNKYMRSTGKAECINEITCLYPEYPSPRAILSMITDGIFQIPAYKIADAQSNFASAYSYRFDWTSLPIRLIGLGACHGLELPFIFSSFQSDAGKRIMQASSNRKVKNMSKQMQNAWINFARTGKPGSETRIWPEYNTQTRPTLIFDNTIKIVSDPIAKLRQGWEVIR